MPKFTIPVDHPSLPGHFPGRPVVPGVVILEQVLKAWHAQADARPICGLQGIKFQRQLLPEQIVRIDLEEVDADGVRFRVALADGQLVSGQLRLVSESTL